MSMLDDAPAAKSDLAAVKSELSAEIASARSDLSTEIASVRSDLSTEIASVRSDLSTEIASVRSDLSASTKRLALEIVNTNGRIDRLETSLRDEMARNTSRIMDSIDDFAKKSEARENEIVLHGRAITEIRVELKKYDGRLTALEGPRP